MHRNPAKTKGCVSDLPGWGRELVQPDAHRVNKASLRSLDVPGPLTCLAVVLVDFGISGRPFLPAHVQRSSRTPSRSVGRVHTQVEVGEM